MRWIAGVSALLIGLCGFMPWIEAPLSGGIPVSGLRWIAAILGVLSGVACYCGSGRSGAVCGVAGLGLCSFLVLHLTFGDPLFWRLVDENEQYAQMMAFSIRFLPGNFGSEPMFQPALSTESVFDRLATAAYFVSYGWWSCLMGSVLLLAGALTVEGWRSVRWIVATCLVILGGLGLIFFKGFAAQHLQARGDRDLGHERFAEAIQQYQAAQELDPQLLKHERLHLRLGEAYDRLGMASHPNVHFYRGDFYSQQGDWEAAVVAYRLATRDASRPLAEIIEKRMARTYVTMGLAQYRKENIGHAVALWEKALTFDQEQLLTTYFLTKAYFDQGRYEQSIAMGRLLLARSWNQLVNANVHANIGDDYWRLQDYSSARNAYQTSLQLDPFANFRIIKSLGGT
jgi:predicted negative regulator of RcsB-dependent stress response